MRIFSTATTLLILSGIIITDSNTLAATKCLDSKEVLVCTQKKIDSIPTNTCVRNQNLKGHFASNPFSVIGDCSNFDINKIKTYACNAGLRFIPQSKIICIRRDQDNSVSSSCGDSLDCTCSNGTENNINTNYFNFGIDTYNSGSTPDFTQRTLDASLTQQYAMASNNTGSDILEDGSALQFNFGSELYGAEYFVDICIKNDNSETKANELKLNGKILFGNAIFKTNNYITSSSLETKVETTCTTQKEIGMPISQLDKGGFINGERRFKESVIPSAGLCVVRHYFKEMNTTNVRENNYKKVTFQTLVDVTPKNSSLLTPTPIQFCNITLTKKLYVCESFTTLNNETLKISLKDDNFFGPNTYTGQCPAICLPIL